LLREDFDRDLLRKGKQDDEEKYQKNLELLYKNAVL